MKSLLGKKILTSFYIVLYDLHRGNQLGQQYYYCSYFCFKDMNCIIPAPLSMMHCSTSVNIPHNLMSTLIVPCALQLCLVHSQNPRRCWNPWIINSMDLGKQPELYSGCIPRTGVAMLGIFRRRSKVSRRLKIDTSGFQPTYIGQRSSCGLWRFYAFPGWFPLLPR